MMIPLQAVTPEGLADAIGISLAEARKIVSAVHRLDMLPPGVRGVRRTILESVRRSAFLPALTVRASHSSRVDPFVKYALQTLDGQVIEARKQAAASAALFALPEKWVSVETFRPGRLSNRLE
jgi:hypothetical protein